MASGNTPRSKTIMNPKDVTAAPANSLEQVGNQIRQQVFPQVHTMSNLKSRYRTAVVALSCLLSAASASASGDSATTKDDLRAARSLSNAFRSVAKQLAPSVVSVRTIDRVPYDGQPGIPITFGGPLPDRVGQGSGVIVSEDGFVLTNFHVIRGADQINIRLLDRREIEASVVGVDPDTDLAVLKVEATDLVPAQFGDSEAIEAGEWVVALGNPFGLEQTVTAGIISAKGRSGMGLATYENFLQTDAAINPGNSGGALIDLDGRVVGINTAISSPDGVNHGVGFAIPSAMAQRVANELIERGHVLRGWLGVGVAPVLRGTEKVPGAILTYVAPDAPAWRAGLRMGDLVVQLDDRAVDSPSDLIRVIGERPPESEIMVTALRDGRSIRTTAVLGERPTQSRQKISFARPGRVPPAAAPTPGVPGATDPSTSTPDASPAPDAPSAGSSPRGPGGAADPSPKRRLRERAEPVD